MAEHSKIAGVISDCLSQKNHISEIAKKKKKKDFHTLHKPFNYLKNKIKVTWKFLLKLFKRS